MNQGALDRYRPLMPFSHEDMVYPRDDGEARAILNDSSSDGLERVAAAFRIWGPGMQRAMERIRTKIVMDAIRDGFPPR